MRQLAHEQHTVAVYHRGQRRNSHFNYAHDIAYDTSRIRSELGYREIIDEREAVLRTLKE